MKKILSIIAVVILAATSLFAQNQTKKPADLAKLKAETAEVYKKSLKAKPTKEAKNEAKKLVKDGWTVQAGERSIEQQISATHVFREEVIMDENNNLTKRYIVQSGMNTAGTYNAAQAAARANAMVGLASLIKTQLGSAIENAIDNAQSTEITAVTVEKFHERSRAIVDQTLTFSLPVVTIYRRSNNNFEVQVSLAYDRLEIMARIKRNMQKELEIEGDVLDTIVEDAICNKIQ